MKTLLLCIALISILQTNAQTPEEQKAWETFMTPSAGHKQLAKEVGYWEGEVKYWMDPSQPPTSHKASYDIKMILNGLFQEMDYTSDFMGNPFIGKSITGYNNHKKEYESLWVDGMGSGFVKMTGFWDEGTQTYNYKGIQTDPITGQDTEIRQEMKMVSATNFTLAMFGPGKDGKEIKFMEGNFKKTKKPAATPAKPVKKKATKK